MANSLKVDVQFPQAKLRRLIRALEWEADGAELKAKLEVDLIAIGETAAVGMRGAIMAMPSMHQSLRNRWDPTPLRVAMARSVAVEADLSFDNPSVAIVSHRSKMPRRGKDRTRSTLWQAAKLYNRGSTWEHPVFGSRRKVSQTASRGRDWFDGPWQASKNAVRRQASKAVSEMMRRIQARTEG